MPELYYITTLYPRFGRYKQKLLFDGLRNLQRNKLYTLYLQKEKSLEEVEAALEDQGLSVDIIQKELYQLRYDLNMPEEMFYTAISATDPLYRIKSEDAGPADRLVDQATEYIRCKEYNKAELLLNTALTMDDNSFLAYANLGVIAFRQHQLERALIYYNEALSIAPNHIDLLCHKMFTLTAGKTAALLELTQLIDKILELNPDHPSALDYKCQLAFQARDIAAMKKYAPHYFQNYYLETPALQHLHNLLLLMSADEGMAFLNDFASRQKGDFIRKKLIRVANKHSRLVKKFAVFSSQPMRDLIIEDKIAQRKKRKRKSIKVRGKYIFAAL